MVFRMPFDDTEEANFIFLGADNANLMVLRMLIKWNWGCWWIKNKDAKMQKNWGSQFILFIEDVVKWNWGCWFIGTADADILGLKMVI